MYAVVETSGKQYKVAKNDIILVDRFQVKNGAETKLSKVLLVHEANTVHVGSPYVKGAHVICECLGQVRGDKVIAFKYKKRKSEKKKIGHRSELTKLKVKEIEIAKG